MSTDYSIRQMARIISRTSRAQSKRYTDYIRSPKWRQIRTEHLEACDYWCEICQIAKACQVHHATYANLGNERPIDLVAVCVRCHHRIHCLVPEAANDNEQLALPLPREAA